MNRLTDISREVLFFIVGAIVSAIISIPVTESILKYRTELEIEKPRHTLVEIFGKSVTEDRGVLVVYATFESIIPYQKGAYRYKNDFLDETQKMHGPDIVLSENEIRGLKQLLDLTGNLKINTKFDRHTKYLDATNWPDQAIIAVGGPYINAMTRYIFNQETPLQLEKNTMPWTMTIKPINKTLTYMRDNLSYGIIYRIKNPNSKDNFITTIWGADSYGTEAACHYLRRNAEDVARLLKIQNFILLEVINNGTASPALLFPKVDNLY